jgi:hypothetical protein
MIIDKRRFDEEIVIRITTEGKMPEGEINRLLNDIDIITSQREKVVKLVIIRK